MSDDLNILIIPGSLRVSSINKKVAKVMANILTNINIKTTVLEPQIFNFPLYNQDIEDKLRASNIFPLIANLFKKPDNIIDMQGLGNLEAVYDTIMNADAIILANPEYNSQIPAITKNLLDWMSRINAEFLENKLVALTTASPGGFGGIRSMSSLIELIISNLYGFVFPRYLCLPRAHEAFDGENLKEEKRTIYVEFLTKFIAAAKVLKTLTDKSKKSVWSE